MYLPIPGAWQTAIESYLDHERAANAPDQTITTRRNHLNHLARRLGTDPWLITADELVAWAGKQEWAAQTKRTRRITFRSFWKWGVRTKRAEKNIAKRLPRIRQEVKKHPPIPEPIYQATLRRVDPRTGIILRLAHDAGLRRAEIALVHRSDMFQDLVGWSLIVHGKGNKDRIVPLTKRLAFELLSYFEMYLDDPNGWLLPGDDHGHLSPRWVGKLATIALPGKWTLHSLRRSFGARTYFEGEKDLLVVQELLGHVSTVTTQGYIVVPSDNLRRAVEAADRTNDYQPRQLSVDGKIAS